MSAPLTASMPQFAQLAYNTSVVVEALDPSTGAPVTGVTVSAVEIWADVTTGADSGGSQSLVVGPYMLVGGPQA